MMLPTTTYKQGDVLLVPFTFSDQSAVKQRPAVVLSGVAYNRIHPDIILAPITSQMRGILDELPINEWRTAGLLKPSAVKPILSSFDTSLVRRQLGSLSDDDRTLLKALFSRILDLP